jgi:hypothetical protein
MLFSLRKGKVYSRMCIFLPEVGSVHQAAHDSAEETLLLLSFPAFGLLLAFLAVLLLAS